MSEDWQTNWGCYAGVRVCVTCKGKYIPSATSHPTKCYNCVTFTRQRRPTLKQIEPSIKRPLGKPDPMLPVDTNFCKCSACGEYFGGVGAFDLHRVGRVGSDRDRACLAPSVVADKKNRPLLNLNKKGYWVRTYQ